MRQLEKLEKYVITPNVGFYGGYVHDGEDIELCDDHDTEEGYDFRVKQRIENDVLITDLKRAYKKGNQKEVKEESHMEVELEKGTLIVYVPGMGFVLPESQMCTVEEAAKQFEFLKGVGHDVNGNEKEGTAANRRD